MSHSQPVGASRGARSLSFCFVLFQSPPKGATIPYRPKPQVGGPVILAGGQAFTIQGNYAVPAHSDVSTVMPMTAAPAVGTAPLNHPPSLNGQTLQTSAFAAAAAHHPSSPFAASPHHGHHPLLPAHLAAAAAANHHHHHHPHHHHPLHPSSLHASVAGLADPLLKSGHLQAALPPAHLVADAVSLLFFVTSKTRSKSPTPSDKSLSLSYQIGRASCRERV